MKIAFIAYMHGFGGAEKQLILLANEMAKRGHEVSILSLYKDNACFKIDEKIDRIFIPDEKKGLLLKLNRFNQLRKRLKKIKPDVTVSFWFQSAFFTTFIPKKYVGKVIYSERGDPGDKEYNGMRGILRKIAFKKIDGFVFQTKVAKDYFNKKVRQKSVVIHNPVLIKKEDYSIPTERENKIVTVGRLHEQKNQSVLIEVFAQFVNKHPECQLEIYGEGDLKAQLQEQIEKLNITDNVTLMGTKTNIFDWIVKAKMFVLTSLYEGMPNALIEAMALGIPTITSNYAPKDSVYEFVQNGVNGFVYENREQLLENMEKIFSDPKVADRLSQNSKKICEENSKDIIYDKWEQFFKNNT